MIKKFGKKLINNRRFLIALAAVCALTFILTVTFFVRYVLDCVSGESSVNVENKNDVRYIVYYDNEKMSDTEKEFLKEINDSYSDKDLPKEFSFKFLDRIAVYNNCTALVTKNGAGPGILNLECSYSVTGTFIIKNQGATVSSIKEVLSKKDGVAHEARHGAEPDNVYAFIDSKDGYFDVDLALYKEKFEAFAKENKELRLTAELWIEFEFMVSTARGSELYINSTTKRGIVIPVSSSTFKVDFIGQANLSKNFPERTMRFPGTVWTVLVTLLAALTVAGVILPLKKLLEEKDAYKKAVKVILRKYGDEIVMADPGGALPDYPFTDVQNYKELAKFSQTMNKPVICFKTDSEAVFYITCDNTLYRFVVKAQQEKAGEDEEIEAVVERHEREGEGKEK